MIQRGDTFFWDPEGGNNGHLWIVLTSPDPGNGQCVIINLTSSSSGPASFTLKVGDHPYITKKSDVNFGDAMISTVTKIEAAVKYGQAVPNQPMDSKILEQIAQTAKTHCAPARGVKKIIATEWA